MIAARALLRPPTPSDPRVGGLFLAVLAAWGASCSAYSDYLFSPSVHDVEVRDPSEELLARVLIAPRGIARRKSGQGSRIDVRFRVRLENRSRESLELVPAELELVDANLESFGRPEVIPVTSRTGGEEETGAGAKSLYMLFFPFPEGRTPSTMDLHTLRLRIGLRHNRELLLPTATFERVHRYAYDPYGYRYYPGVSWSVGIGYGYVD